MARCRIEIEDSFLIYESSEDDCWIAHSLRTDQIGTGDCIVDALADGMRAVQAVLALAERRSDVQVLREAPADIRRMATKAKPLPGELYEIAYKMVHGDWPEADFDTNVRPRSKRAKRFRTDNVELVSA